MKRLDRITKYRNITLNEVADYFKNQPGVIGIFLSGSMAADTADGFSDIDLRVVLSDKAHPQFVADRLHNPKKWNGFLFNEWVEGTDLCITHFKHFFKLDLFYLKESDFLPDPWFRLPTKILFDPYQKLKNVFILSEKLEDDGATDLEALNIVISKSLACAHEVLRNIRRNELLQGQYHMGSLRMWMIKADSSIVQWTAESAKSGTKLDHKVTVKTRDVLLNSFTSSSPTELEEKLSKLLHLLKSQIIRLHEMYDLDRPLRNDLKAIELVNQLID